MEMEMEMPVHVALSEWFKTQTKWKSRAELGRALEIKESTLGDYFTGRHQPGPENRQKLFKATGLECFKPPKEKVAPRVEVPIPQQPEKLEIPWDDIGDQLVEIGKAVARLGKLLTHSPASDVAEKVEAVEDILYTLNDELEFFKQGSANSREILRQRLSGPDVGYVTTLLKALFDEEKFQNWLAMTTHEVRR